MDDIFEELREERHVCLTAELNKRPEERKEYEYAGFKGFKL